MSWNVVAWIKNKHSFCGSIKTYEEAIEIARDYREQFGCRVVYYEASPDQHITFQGEFVESDHGPMLEYSRAKTAMRDALKKERILVFGPGARLVLKSYLSEASYEDFLALGQLYPDCVIEFTAYEVFVGDIPGRNAVVWEVRNY